MSKKQDDTRMEIDEANKAGQTGQNDKAVQAGLAAARTMLEGA